MRGRVAKALRRLKTSSEQPGDMEIVMRRAAAYRAHAALAPKLEQPRRRKISGVHGPQGYSDKQMQSHKRHPPVVVKPLRRLRSVARDMGLELGQYLRLKTEYKASPSSDILRHYLRGENHAGAQPKLMLDRMSSQ